jgi:replicative DNA helicase
MGNLANTLESLQPVPVVDKTTAILNAYASLTTDKCLGLSTGYDELDKLLDGLRKGNLIILAGRPAMGKTTFALNIVANLCKAGKKVVFYSLEMTQEEIYQKLITRESKISPVEAKSQVIRDKQTKNNTLFSDEVRTFKEKESRAFWTRLQLGMDDVSKWHLDILDQCNSELRDIRLSAKIQAKRKDVDLIVIDYLQLMSDKGHESRVAEVTAISKGLKNLAKELEIPILALAQLNRNVEKQTNKRPTKADLRESGSIEQDADKIILIYRDDYYAKNGKPYTELIVDKTRMGKNGTALVEFFPAISRFEDYKGKL